MVDEEAIIPWAWESTEPTYDNLFLLQLREAVERGREKGGEQKTELLWLKQNCVEHPKDESSRDTTQVQLLPQYIDV